MRQSIIDWKWWRRQVEKGNVLQCVYLRARRRSKMKALREEKVAAVVNQIIDDLSDRRGLRQEWESIDEDTKKVIRQRWCDILRDVM